MLSITQTPPHRIVTDSSALVNRLSNEFERMLDQVLVNGARPSRTGGRLLPAMNIWEDETRWVVELDVPGYRMEDIEIAVQGDELRLSGSRTVTQPENATLHRSERLMGEFARTIQLANGIDTERVEASLENGVLSVTLPKAESQRPRRVTITKR